MGTEHDPTAERLAFGLLVLFLASYGWFDLLQGGIAMKGRSGAVAFVDGIAGLLVAAGAFAIAALVSLLLAKSFGWGRAARVALIATIVLPPVVWVAVR